MAAKGSANPSQSERLGRELRTDSSSDRAEIRPEQMPTRVNRRAH